MIEGWKSSAKNNIKGKIGILFLIGLFTSFTGGNFGGISFNFNTDTNSNFLYFNTNKELYIFIFVVIAICIAAICSAFIIAPFTLSRHYVYLKVARGENVRFVDAFYGFKDYFSALKLYFLTNIYVLLWLCLFIIPGIVASYKYLFAFHYLADNPGASARECIRRSKEITNGYKRTLFALDLSFIGWNLLVSMTLGILGIWVYPYHEASYSSAYLDLSTNDLIYA